MPDKPPVLGQRTLKSGKILLNGGASVLDCTIRELSAVGARLQFGPLVHLPGSFTLEFLVGAERWRVCCIITWRQMNEIGVTFDGPAS
jgi:hypothetical protein